MSTEGNKIPKEWVDLVEDFETSEFIIKQSESD